MPSLGMWREHLPYQVSIDVTASDNTVFAATPSSLFTVDINTKDIERFSKVSGLSETGISTIQYDAATKKLFIAYTNSNIDVLEVNSIKNIPDIKRSNISGDKNIYHIFPDGSRCYLSSGLGVIVLDAAKYEVKDSWFIGNSGGYVKVNGFTKNNQFFFAATEEGLKRTAISTGNPADFQSWINLSGVNGLTAAPAKAVVNFANKIIVLQNDSLFVESGATWTLFFANGWPVTSINVSNNKLLICQQQGSLSKVVSLQANGNIGTEISRPGQIAQPKKAVSIANDFWIADISAGLVHVAGNNVENYKLNSPQNIVTGDVVIKKNVLLAAAGSVNSSWNYQYNPGGIFKFSQKNWSAYNQYSLPQLDSMLDFITVAPHPTDNSIWAGSFGGGLLHIDAAGKPKIFKQQSPLQAPPGDPTSYRVAGLAFDENENLWIANFGSNKQLHVNKADHTWQSFTVPFMLNENAVAQILIDDEGKKWIQAPLGNGLIVFDQGKFDNAADDRWRMYRTGAGQGNLPSNEVLCLAKDKSGFIWVGTDNGVAVIQCTGDALTGGCNALWPVIKEGAFANYLFKGQEVRSIAVDGADRKWVATSNGVWLVSPDGDKILASFNETNSPLLSNDVRKIAIDGATGEVYFATAKGLIAYRGSATEAKETKNNILVFPNPVPPGHNGNIGIRGLPENSQVKITEANGRLVYQTRALGGQAVWNGKDYTGRKAATGVYLVIAIDQFNSESVVTKIVFVNK